LKIQASPLLRILFAAAAIGGFAAPAAAASLAPHRAIYELSLVSAKSSSSVTGVDGRMLVEWKDVCDGWTLEQRFQMGIQYAEGSDIQSNTSYITWESKDGRRYRFNIRKLLNGELDEEHRGEATLMDRQPEKGSGGTVTFTQPEQKTVDLPAGTLFPTTHTVRLLEAAEADTRFFPRVIFDGADGESATLVGAAIGKGGGTAAGVSEVNLPKQLVERPSWPVRMAFFPLETKGPEGEVPDYEMSVRLFENGVAGDMLIDYGDYTVRAVLKTLEGIPPAKC